MARTWSGSGIQAGQRLHYFEVPLLARVGAVFFALAGVLLIALVRKLTEMHPADEKLLRGM